MKAIVYTTYGSPDVLALKEVAQPIPGDDDVLVKVHAASINSWDWDLVRGKPLWARMWGLWKPKYHIPGADIAGRVCAVGKNITKFKPDDEVFGDLCDCGWGGFAEYVCAPETALMPKPAGTTFEQAAAVPQAAVMALQGIRDYGQVQSGQKVLINGAGGGVGTFAIQFAKLAGADVTGVDSAGKLDLMRSIGADHVIDYAQEDFTKNGQRYDLILDCVMYRSIFTYTRALRPRGQFVFIGGSVARAISLLILGPLISRIGTKKLGFLAHKPNKNIALINEFIESGKITPAIDRCYSLHEVPEAFRYFATGQAKGKIVITVDHNT